MGRIRSIKPEFPHSESMGRVSRDARLTFILLWTIADDSGRLRGNSRMLASLLFPYDSDAPKQIDKWLGELSREKCIVRYKVNGDHYIEIHNWLVHQRIDKPTKSKIEPFANFREDSSSIRESSCGDGNGMEGIGEEWIGEEQGPEVADLFARFWEVFPAGRKQGKEAARKAWQSAIKKCDPGTIVAAAEEYAASPVGRGEYVKGPAPWLNQGCWDDDRASWQRGNGTPRVGPGQVHDPDAAKKDPNHGRM